jgi:hypothetical protein
MTFAYPHRLVLDLDRVGDRAIPVRVADHDRVTRGHLPIDVRDDQPEPLGRCPQTPGRPGMADGAVRGTTERRAGRALQPDPRTDQAIHQLTLAHTSSVDRPTSDSTLLVDTQRDRSRRGRGQLPERREGTMSITMSDPASRLLDLAPPPIGPPPPPESKRKKVATDQSATS